MTDAVVLYTTWPDDETAGAAALAAVEAKLAACANLLAPARSTYRWEGRIETASETPVLFKTTAAAAADLRDLIVARHPYDTPAVLAFPAGAASHRPYLDWIEAGVASGATAPPYGQASGGAALEGER